MTLAQRDVDTLEAQIQRFAESLVERRDHARENAEKYVYTRDEYLTEELAYRQALSSLHIFTDGAYGQLVEEQPEPLAYAQA